MSLTNTSSPSPPRNLQANMQEKAMLQPPHTIADVQSQLPAEFRKRDGTVSNMRSHKGNIPVLPQNKLCPSCPAKFTRTTHLNRHLRTHTNERLHRCDTCDATFTRSDLLTRHKKSCLDPSGRTRRKSCIACMESKIKCDRLNPCSRCTLRGRECVFPRSGKRTTFMLQNTTPSIPPLPTSTSSAPVMTAPGFNLFPEPLLPISPQGVSSQPSASTPSTSYSSPQSTSFPASMSEDMPRQLFSGGAPLIGDVSEDFAMSSSAFDSSPPSAEPLIEVYSPATSDSNRSDSPMPVNSHLSPMFMNDADDFVKLLSNVFPQAEASFNPKTADKDVNRVPGYKSDLQDTAPPFARPPPSQLVRQVPSPTSHLLPEQSLLPLSQPPLYEPGALGLQMGGAVFELFGLDTSAVPLSYFSMPSLQSALNDARLLPVLDVTSLKRDTHTPEELQHYLYYFFAVFLSHLPILHAPTLDIARKPPILISAMQACGALFVRTRKAGKFISEVLAASRDLLKLEFSKQSMDPMDQMHLILAVVLLQTIGLFHQEAEERSSSAYYHAMLVLLIKRTNMIKKNAEWRPRPLLDGTIEEAWLDWIQHELTKRALLWSYMHDCCHCIYFALQPSYHPSEVELYLPCDTAIWQARNAEEWHALLRSDSTFPSIEARLIGEGLQQTLNYMMRDQLIFNNIQTPLGGFAHFALTHGILRELFHACAESRSREYMEKVAADPTGPDDIQRKILALGYALQNWLHNWTNGPEFPQLSPNQEPPFIANVLPFYWLGQVALLAYEEGYPPFEPDSTAAAQVAMRFKLVKQWLKHIRGFLRDNTEAVTLRWSELMKMRLRSWQAELEEDSTEDGGILRMMGI